MHSEQADRLANALLEASRDALIGAWLPDNRVDEVE
jgi:hypothetical protein